MAHQLGASEQNLLKQQCLETEAETHIVTLM